jgi:peptidoglycan/xylan/chitin deacetylase (PgdA/CDA1 family)
MRTCRLSCVRVLAEALGVGAVSAVLFLAGLVLVSVLSPRSGFSPGTPVTRWGSAVEEGPAGRASTGSSIIVSGKPVRAARDAALEARSSSGVPVLCHHYLRAKTTPRVFARILGALFLNLPLLGDMDVWTQTTEMFDAQMGYLKREGYTTVDFADVVAWRRGLRELPPRPIVVTFDDGDRSVLEHAYPVLKKYGFKATLFVVTSKVGQKWERVDCLGWDELRALHESGVFSIQSHSHDLHRKVRTSEGALPVFVGARLGVFDMPGGASWSEAVSRDLRTSKDLIERHVGGEVTCLSWPYGFGDAELDSVAASAGYSVLCTLAEGTNRDSAQKTPADRLLRDKWGVRRYTVTARTSLRSFEKMLTDRPPAAE